MGERTVLLDGDGDAAPEEELVTGRRLPRWLSMVGALAIAGVVFGVLVGRGGRQPTAPVARPRPAPTAAAAGPGQPMSRSATATYDVAIAPSGTWMLRASSLVRLDDGLRVAVPALHADSPGVTAHVIVDPAAPRMWVLVPGEGSTRMIEFDAQAGRLLRDVTWRAPTRYAVAYQGSLYLTGDRGAAVLASGAHTPVPLPGLRRATGAMAVDADRDRLIVAGLGLPTQLWTYRPGAAAARPAGLLRVTKATVAVVGGAIWLGGYGQQGAVLDRLDPRTLRPVATSPQAANFSPGAIIVGSGPDLVWLADQSGVSSTLSCMDAASGQVQYAWALPNFYGMASDWQKALVATPSGLLELPLAECGVSGRIAGSPIRGHFLR